jgi:hypothetical protein
MQHVLVRADDGKSEGSLHRRGTGHSKPLSFQTLSNHEGWQGANQG